MSEQVYRLKRGPQPLNFFGFAVSQVARSPRFQLNNRVLRRKMRWPLVFTDCSKHPGLKAILVPNTNTMEDRTPLWHNNQRQVGVGRPPTRHRVVSGESHPQKVADLGSSVSCS